MVCYQTYLSKLKGFHGEGRRFCIILLFLSLFLFPATIFAGGTPSTELQYPFGSASSRGNGDYISRNTTAPAGLNTYFAYFIEVPPTTGNLTVDIFDADIRSNNDFQLGGSWNTNVRYTLTSPTGATTTLNCYAGGCAARNNVWSTTTGFTIANPTPGHWEFRMNMSSPITTGDDLNGFGVRARDTSATPKELNMYAQSFSEQGLIGTYPATASAHLYPYITSGCVFDSNDFDSDSYVTINCVSRTGAFTSNISTTSANDVWANNPVTAWTTDVSAVDYGIWPTTMNLQTAPGQSGNLVTYYIGNYAAANPPPTTQPQANTFRIYLPTYNNGGAAGVPAKPFLTQTLSWVSGPNPPANGSTTRVRVQATIFNPTAFPITFSASNLITANVPGAGATYVGASASVTQGSIVSQPGGGGTGNITWNPGTVAANTYQTLIYDVNIAPTSAGQVINVTATPASGNGTRATFVDETCSGAAPACAGTQLTNATFTFGPICELKVTEGGTPLPTFVVLSSFGAYEENGRVVVQWETATEINTAGFYLFREDDTTGEYIQLNEELLPGLLTSPQGGTYRYRDGTALPGGTYTYKLVEVETRGRKHTYGPFTVTAATKAAALSSFETQSASFSSKARGLKAARHAGLHTAKISSKALSTQPVNGKVKIAVADNGLYYLRASDIAPLMGLTSANAQNRIRRSQLLLSSNGQAVAYLPAADNAGIYFYGEGIDSIYTKENVYWLEKGSGITMQTLRGKGPSPADDAQAFTETIHIEEDHWPATGLFGDPGADFWLWDYIAASPAGSSKTFTITAHGVASSPGQATLEVHLKGGADTDAPVDHHAVIALNGTGIGEARWDGIEAMSLTLPFDQSLLHEGDNTVTVTGILPSEVDYSIFYIDSFDLTYQRYYHAENNRLFLKGNGNPVVTVDGFTNSDIRVFDVTDPIKSKYITALTVDADRVSFRPASADARYLVLTGDALNTPASLTAGKASNLKDRKNASDYILIAPDALMAALRPLADYRRAQGFKPLVADLETIMDEFNYGIYAPKAIRDFLSYAYTQWNKAPKYVLLAGKGTFDYKNNLGAGGNLCPVVMMTTPDGLFPSDNSYADGNGDHIPDMAIGRLPVTTSGELQDVIGKIIAYETAASGGWTRSVLMLADNPDEGGNFPADSDTVASLLPQGYTAEKIYLSEHPINENEHPIAEARQMVMDGINSGALFLNFIGHGNLFTMAVDEPTLESLLSIDDIPFMTNQEKLPVVTAMTCMAGNFSFPGIDSIGEGLFLKPGGGAVGVWAPTGWSINSEAVILDQAFYQTFFVSPAANNKRVLGNTVLRALKKGARNGVPGYILDMYSIIGDPALRLK